MTDTTAATGVYFRIRACTNLTVSYNVLSLESMHYALQLNLSRSAITYESFGIILGDTALAESCICQLNVPDDRDLLHD